MFDREKYFSLISKLRDRKEKQLVKLVLKEITYRKKKNKLSKREVDLVVMDKKDLIKRTRDNLISMSKHEIVNYGPWEKRETKFLEKVKAI